MSLVPILYTALLIFVLFSLVVVIISYVSYKVRKKSEPEENNFGESRYYNTYYSPTEAGGRSSAANTNAPNSIKVVSTIKRPEQRKTVELPYYPSQSKSDPYREEIEQYSANEKYERDYAEEDQSATRYTVYDRDEENSKQEKVKSYHYMPRTKANLNRNRIQIINKTQEERNNISSNDRFHSSGSGKIALPKYYAGFQAISYYSEEKDDENFFRAAQNKTE